MAVAVSRDAHSYSDCVAALEDVQDELRVRFGISRTQYFEHLDEHPDVVAHWLREV